MLRGRCSANGGICKVESMRPEMVIIMDNTLSGMALRSLLMDIITDIPISTYNSLEEYETKRQEGVVVAHYFVSAAVVFRNPEFFRDTIRRTIVFTDGEASTFVQSGFHTIDATASEQQIARHILEVYRLGHPGGHTQHGVHVTDRSNISPLSARENDVLALMVKGYINKEIADKLSISQATVIFHRNNICEKLNTRSLGRLTIYAVLNNVVSLSDL